MSEVVWIAYAGDNGWDGCDHEILDVYADFESARQAAIDYNTHEAAPAIEKELARHLAEMAKFDKRYADFPKHDHGQTDKERRDERKRHQLELESWVIQIAESENAEGLKFGSYQTAHSTLVNAIPYTVKSIYQGKKI